MSEDQYEAPNQITRRPENTRTTEEVLDTSLSTIEETVNGIVSSDRKDWSLSVGKLSRAIRRGGFLGQFVNEWKELKGRGKIDDGYEETEQHQACLDEMMDFLDNHAPDQVTFDFAKKVFMATATGEGIDRGSLLPQQYMRVAKALSTAEVVVLAANYKAYKEVDVSKLANSEVGFGVWAENIAIKSGLEHSELVAIQDKSLSDKNLLTPRIGHAQTIVNLSPCYRFTSFGLALCEYIEDDDTEEVGQ